MAMPPSWPLDDRLPPRPVLADEALDLFLGWANGAHGSLYPAQEDAILALYSGSSVILETPTGSGKSLVAVSLAFKALAEGKRFVWTCPIKALVSEKFFDLCRLFGPEKVGLATGDGSVNRDAPITVCTAEILSMQSAWMSFTIMETANAASRGSCHFSSRLTFSTCS